MSLTPDQAQALMHAEDTESFIVPKCDMTRLDLVRAQMDYYFPANEFPDETLERLVAHWRRGGVIAGAKNERVGVHEPFLLLLSSGEGQKIAPRGEFN